jgi:hypothetical protein
MIDWYAVCKLSDPSQGSWVNVAVLDNGGQLRAVITYARRESIESVAQRTFDVGADSQEVTDWIIHTLEHLK